MQAQRQALDPQRWHFQHGPIDLVIQADGDAAGVQAAHAAAWDAFQTMLPGLVRELAQLRQAVQPTLPNPMRGAIARSMWQACAPLARPCPIHPEGFITAMAAVAGAVAQAVLAFYQGPGIERAWVNNGGDIALHLTPDSSVRIGLVSDIARAWDTSPLNDLVLDGALRISADMPVRGIATSGWRGRSQSLGIADSVTVLAASAAQADAAATLIANAVNVDDPRIVRQAANQLREDADLGPRLVTVDVPPLSPAHIERALARGRAYAHQLQTQGLIHAALLCCQGQTEVAGHEACLA
jgi:ApbE superfamily uncharacterized protein (UPF0280 family)